MRARLQPLELSLQSCSSRIVLQGVVVSDAFVPVATLHAWLQIESRGASRAAMVPVELIAGRDGSVQWGLGEARSLAGRPGRTPTFIRAGPSPLSRLISEGDLAPEETVGHLALADPGYVLAQAVRYADGHRHAHRDIAVRPVHVSGADTSRPSNHLSSSIARSSPGGMHPPPGCS